jgi:hypothetical protein
VFVQRRKCAGGNGPAERDSHLADAEGKAALVLRKPAHHGPAAGRVDTRAQCASERQRGDETPVRGRAGGSDEGGSRAGLAHGDDRALADAVGDDPPRQQGHDGAEVDGRQHDAHL